MSISFRCSVIPYIRDRPAHIRSPLRPSRSMELHRFLLECRHGARQAVKASIMLPMVLSRRRNESTVNTWQPRHVSDLCRHLPNERPAKRRATHGRSARPDIALANLLTHQRASGPRSSIKSTAGSSSAGFNKGALTRWNHRS
jgi:hypothetical protein